jgi:hypothetical protein
MDKNTVGTALAITLVGLAAWSIGRHPSTNLLSNDDESEGVSTTLTDVHFPGMRNVLGRFYIDKTELIEKLISMGEKRVDFVLRPRRCGKSAMLSMLRCGIPTDSYLIEFISL